ncbi:MAG: MBL fold metallo-hydrolase, partial [Bacteroidota bacterium]
MGKKIHFRFTLLLLLFTISPILSQKTVSKNPKNNDIKIIPIEHATAVLTWNGITIYIDPVGGKEAFKDIATPDLILISDIHGDHFSLKTLEELDTHNAKIMVPQAVAE